MLDLAALALIVIGGGSWLRGYLGLRALRAGLPPTPGQQPFAALRLADHYYLLSRIGMGLIVAGLVIAVGAAISAGRRARPGGAG